MLLFPRHEILHHSYLFDHLTHYVHRVHCLGRTIHHHRITRLRNHWLLGFLRLVHQNFSHCAKSEIKQKKLLTFFLNLLTFPCHEITYHSKC